MGGFSEDNIEPVRSPEKASAAAGLNRQSFARGGLLNLIGAGISGVSTFAMVLVLTRRIGVEQVGAFMVSVAAVTIVAQTTQLGANTGLVRFVPMMRVRGQQSALPELLPLVLGVVATAGLVGGLVMYLTATGLASLLGSDQDAQLVVDYMRSMAFVVPSAAVFLVAAQGSQAFGTMTPAVLVDKIGRSVVQVVAVGLLATSGVTAIVLGYGAVYSVGVVVLGFWIFRSARNTRTNSLSSAPPVVEFWKFSLPRAVSTTFQVTVLWADTILIGFLRSSEEAAIYSVATRYLVIGHLFIGALLQAMGPRLAAHLANRDNARAKSIYQRSASWVVAAVWPPYLVIAIFAPWLLQIFGTEFTAGATALRIVAVAMMVAAACGAVDNVLLMAGRSWISVANWGMALVVNIGLNIWLIPLWGIEGAAVAWAASILVRNVIPVVEVWYLFGIHPFSTIYAKLAAAALVTVGAGSLFGAVVLGENLAGFAAGAVPGGFIYLGVLFSLRKSIFGADAGEPSEPTLKP